MSGTHVSAPRDVINGCVAIRINRRQHLFDRIVAVRKIGPGRFEVDTRHLGTFKVEGGKQAGGSRRDWFLDFPDGGKPICCTSLVDALRCIETM